jgi:ABC-2 type transport system ATP-binding protein
VNQDVEAPAGPSRESAAPASESDHIITVDRLSKRYGDLLAVDGISFSVRRGEVFGILGPNGAGKTTTLEMIEGLRQPDGGSVAVDGLAVWPDPKQVKGRIGVQLQATALFDYQKLWEILRVFGSCYGMRRSREEIVGLLDRVGLAEKADSYANELSGGQAQRLSIALALVNDPVVTFLDEPTTGLDPRARRALWDVIRDINASGTTVVLTTHYMEEAERLCDRVAVMDHGRVMALDTPRTLVDSLGAEARVTFTLSEPLPLDELCALDGATTCDAEEDGHYVLQAASAQHAVVSLLALAAERDLRIANLDVQGANLEDVFLAMTGRKLVDDEQQDASGAPAGGKRRSMFAGRER